MTRGDRWLRALLGAALLFGCVTDHEALEKKPNSGASAGGALGSAGSPTQAGAASSSGGTGGGHPDDEAPGKSVLTIINGLVDAPSVVLCLAKVDDAGGATPFGGPLGGAPLLYGQSLVFSAIKGANVVSESLQPFAIAGELDLISGLDCEAAVARAQDEEMAALDANTGAAGAAGAAEVGAAGEGGAAGGGAAERPARLRVRGLPTIVAGTLSAGFSILYVSTGCLGGATYAAKNASEYCGAGYTERDPTASAVLVALSRKTELGVVGLQFVHASLATAPVDVSSLPPFPLQTPALAIVSNVVEGQVAPRPALLTNAASAYGISKMDRVQVSTQGTSVASYDWSLGLQNGGLVTLLDGSTYALVLIGPRADHAQATTLWNPSRLTVIPVDPPAQ